MNGIFRNPDYEFFKQTGNFINSKDSGVRFRRRQKMGSLEKTFFGGCGCVQLVILLNILLGGVATQYVLNTWLPVILDKAVHVPFWVCAILGLFLGEFTIPAAIITLLLSPFIF